MSEPSPRPRFRVLTQTRGGYGGSPLHDVHIQATTTGELLQAHSFTDESAATAFRERIEQDLDVMDETAFRRKYGLLSES